VEEARYFPEFLLVHCFNVNFAQQSYEIINKELCFSQQKASAFGIQKVRVKVKGVGNGRQVE